MSGILELMLKLCNSLGPWFVHQTLRSREGEWATLRGSGVDHRGKSVNEFNQFFQLRLKERVGV